MRPIAKELREFHRTSGRLRDATRAVCIDRVKRAFGVEWTDRLEGALRSLLAQQRAHELLGELGRIAEELRELARRGDWPFPGHDIRIAIAGDRLRHDAQFLDLAYPVGRIPVQAVGPDWAPLGPVTFHRFPAPPPEPSPSTDRQRLVRAVRRTGLLCRCSEVQGLDRCPFVADGTGTAEPLTLPDKTALKCARLARDSEIAAVSLLLQGPEHFDDAKQRAGGGSCNVKYVLDKETDTIKNARDELGIPGVPRGRRRDHRS